MAIVIGAAVVAFVVLSSLPLVLDWWRDRQENYDEQEMVENEPRDAVSQG